MTTPYLVVDTLRSVAAAASYSTRDYQALPAADGAAQLPPRHVVARRGSVDLATAEHVAALAKAMPDDAIIVLVLPADDMESLGNLGTALLVTGLIEADPSGELEPCQTVRSARVA